MADIIGVTVQNYGLKERGVRKFKYDEMKKIRQYLNEELNENLSIDKLFF